MTERVTKRKLITGLCEGLLVPANVTAAARTRPDARSTIRIMPRDPNSSKRGRNDPCWCGSGRKYKHCHLNRNAEEPTTRAEALHGMLSSFKHKECSCPDEWKHECNGNIVRAHSLSRRNALGAVTESGHVFSLVPDWSLVFHKDKFVFKRQSARTASTFTGFCEYHDSKIFLDLDQRDFDGSGDLTFLSAYRTLCREIFMKKAHLRTIELGKTLDKGREEDEQIIIQGATSAASDGANSALVELLDLKAHFEAALKRSNHEAFAYSNFHFPTRPALVTAGGFNPSHDLSGEFLQNLDLATYSQNVFFSVLPNKDGFWASFLWLRSHLLMEHFVRDVERNYCSVGGIYSVALAHIENSFLRPSFWEGLSERHKQALQFLMMMDVLHRDYPRIKAVADELSALYPNSADLVLRG